MDVGLIPKRIQWEKRQSRLSSPSICIILLCPLFFIVIAVAWLLRPALNTPRNSLGLNSWLGEDVGMKMGLVRTSGKRRDKVSSNQMGSISRGSPPRPEVTAVGSPGISRCPLLPNKNALPRQNFFFLKYKRWEINFNILCENGIFVKTFFVLSTIANFA